MNRNIIKFILAFDSPGNRILFTEGYCYYFALILHERFPNSRIVYDPVRCHFITLIEGKFYDITGETKPIGEAIDWEVFPDKSWKSRITRDCIMK